MNRLAYRCIKHESLMNELHCFSLAPVGPSLVYEAGQYVLIPFNDKPHPFSIANAPRPDGQLDFIVRGTPALQSWLASLERAPVMLEGPCGICVLPRTDRPLLFIAGGTGITPINALLNTWANNPNVEATLIWGLRDLKEASMLPPQAWSTGTPLTQHLVEGVVFDTIAKLPQEQLLASTVIACGPLVMIRAIWQQLEALGFPWTEFYSDLKAWV